MLFSFFILHSNFSAHGSEVLWLTNIPPGERQKEITASGMHKLSSIKAGRGKVRIVQWVTRGNNVLSSAYILNSELPEAEIYCYTPEGDLQECNVDSTKHFKELSFNNPLEGYYNLYLIRKEVRNDTLFILTAKAELLNHSCRNGHKDVDEKIQSGDHHEKIPMDIVRKRTRLENLHFFVASGDRISFRVSKSSKPLMDASVTFVTHQGWEKTVKTNRKGEAEIQVIQDYFSPWQDINNRNIYNYLIIADYTSQEKGSFMGESYKHIHYTTSLSDGYYPSKVMYSSLSWALGLFLLCSLIAGGGVVYYRNKRSRVYREIRITNN